MKHVVFDIGNVLVDWHPAPAWIDDLGSAEAVEAFLKRVDFPARNLRCDKGETFADVARELPDPEDARLLALYPSRFPLTVVNEVPGTWAIVDQLEARGVPLHAITNWSAETWPEGLKAHPRLGTMFQTTIVSGAVDLIKPDPAIYRLFLDRSGLAASDCVFVDDKPENIAGAHSVGMDGIHFTDARAFEAALKDRGLL
ncbi:HAD family hydrolase [Pacificoceanicola onchidii]|uniref:HAD family hydrolase n=1 Tax=Pacificoceanicola onchidii TaxID=2562685 RepID=UPI0010A64CCE|nr:HAD family phosphatase [Pacificoceanicola onchidii]